MLTDTQKRLHTKLRNELGREVVAALEDNDVIEIMLNSDNTMWIDKLSSGMEKIEKHSCSAQIAIHTIASYLDTNITIENPILECELPLDGSRFEALVPPVVSHPSFTIRKKAKKIFTLDDYVKNKIITPQQKGVIEAAIQQHKNILIAGGTGSGKTTLTNAIIDSISTITPTDRMVIIEDTAEIQCQSENNVIFRATEFAPMVRLLKATMRYRPDRILVGEVRGGEALTLLKSWNTGHPGGVATVHANNAYAALVRLEQLVAEGTIADSRTVIAEAIDIVIFIEKTQQGRKVTDLLEVERYDFQKNKYITRSI
ncbi:MAG: P-type conjugative transfer ATPase TrbB [Sulfurovaceae bacterium]|nr:P-type conjugative transfer ATPase TrbB [Sulfurovaceae bacterium]